MKESNCPKGVNPEIYKQWKEEDREERVRAVNELIWNWAEGEGLNPE